MSSDEDSLFVTSRFGFKYHSVVGSAAKEIFRSLMEECQYDVYPFGCESTFSVVKRRLTQSKFKNLELALRLRSMPDYLISSSEERPQLVEVKFRRKGGPLDEPGVTLGHHEIGRYTKYWPESILVILSPYKEHFFALQANDQALDPGRGGELVPYSAFRAIDSIFPRTKGKLSDFYLGVDHLTDFWTEPAHRGQNSKGGEPAKNEKKS